MFRGEEEGSTNDQADEADSDGASSGGGASAESKSPVETKRVEATDKFEKILAILNLNYFD